MGRAERAAATATVAVAALVTTVVVTASAWRGGAGVVIPLAALYVAGHLALATRTRTTK